MVENIPGGSYAASDSIEVTAQQVAEHAAYMASLSDEERIAYSAIYSRVVDSMTPYFYGMVTDEKDAVIADQRHQLVEMEAVVEDAYYSAEHDSLTGLLNTRALQQDLEARMQLGKPVIFHLLDLDAFKAVNDTLGHERGDQVLKELSDWLRAKFQRSSDKVARDRVPDSIARPGGDELAVVTNVFDEEENQGEEHTGDADRRQGMTLEERVGSETAYMEAIADEFVAQQPQEIRQLGFGISVGTAYWDPAREPDLTPAQLVRRADLFMYGKKNRPFRIIIERYRDQLEDVFNFLAEIGMSARDLPKLNPRNYTHYTEAPRPNED